MKLPKIRNLNFYSAVVAGGFFVAAMNFTAFGNFAKNSVYTLTQPIQKRVWGFSADISGGIQGIVAVRNALKQNRELLDRINQLVAENFQIEELKNENQTLKEALGLGMEKEYDLRMAETIGTDVVGDSLTIDKGADDMIETGFPVVTSNKVVIGRISKVYDDFAKVDLITGKNMAFDVKLSESGANGLAKGLGGLNIMVDLIPKDVEVKPGSPVTTSAMGGIFPEGYLVGTVDSIEKNDVETFQAAKIKPAFELGRIGEVFIIIGYKFDDKENIGANKTAE